MKKWTIHDDVLLYKLQPDYTVSEISKKIVKSKEDIRVRIKILGLRDFDDRAPLQHLVYTTLELHGNTLNNKIILTNMLGATTKKIGDMYRAVSKKKAINGN